MRYLRHSHSKLRTVSFQLWCLRYLWNFDNFPEYWRMLLIHCLGINDIDGGNKLDYFSNFSALLSAIFVKLNGQFYCMMIVLYCLELEFWYTFRKLMVVMNRIFLSIFQFVIVRNTCETYTILRIEWCLFHVVEISGHNTRLLSRECLWPYEFMKLIYEVLLSYSWCCGLHRNYLILRNY